MGLKEIGVSKLGSTTDEGEPTQHPPSPTTCLSHATQTVPRGGVGGRGRGEEERMYLQASISLPSKLCSTQQKNLLFPSWPCMGKIVVLRASHASVSTGMSQDNHKGSHSQVAPAWSQYESTLSRSEEQLEEVLGSTGSGVVHKGPESWKGVFVTNWIMGPQESGGADWLQSAGEHALEGLQGGPVQHLHYLLRWKSQKANSIDHSDVTRLGKRTSRLSEWIKILKILTGWNDKWQLLRWNFKRKKYCLGGFPS